MATAQEIINPEPPTFGRKPTTPRWLRRRRVNIRRKKQQYIRLGGKQRKGRGLGRLWRKIKVKWSALRYKRILKKLVEYYRSITDELLEVGGSFDSYQQRMMRDPSFTGPALGKCYNYYPPVSVGVPL